MNNALHAFKTQLRETDIPFTENADLAGLTSVHIGSRVCILTRPQTEQHLLTIARAAKSAGLPVWIHGSGTNCFFHLPQDPYPGVVIQWTASSSDIPTSPSVIPASSIVIPAKAGTHSYDARRSAPHSSVHDTARDEVFLNHIHTGIRKSTLARYCLTHALEAGAWLSGIPGTLGGGIAMNAGIRPTDTYGGEFKDIVMDVTRVDLITEKIEVLSLTQEHFSYRAQTFCSPTQLLTHASFRLKKAADPQQFKQAYRSHLNYRKKTQPLKERSFGSTFKNPSREPGQHAAEFIEAAGLKGHTIGGAQISPIHANFFINTAAATSQDMVDLIQHAQSTVHQKFGIMLEREVQIIEAFHAPLCHPRPRSGSRAGSGGDPP